MPTHVYDGSSFFRIPTTRSIARAPSRSDATASSTLARTVRCVSVFISVLQLAEQQEQPAKDRHHLQSSRSRVQAAERDAPGIAFGKTRWSAANLRLHSRDLRGYNQP